MKKRTDVTRIIRKAEMRLNAGAKAIFPLLCPVKEKDWIDGWEDICTIIHTDSGIAEEACVFETAIPLEGHAVWICSRYDAEKSEIEYIKFLVGKAVIKWHMAVSDMPGGKSRIEAVYNATGFGAKGKAFVRRLEEKGIDELFARLEQEINYYIATGQSLKRSAVEKAACRIHGHIGR